MKMESFSFHFVFLGKANLSEVALKLASAQTRSESAKGRNTKQKSALIGNNANLFSSQFDLNFKADKRQIELIVIVDAKNSIMVMGRYMRVWVYAICCGYQTGLYTSCGVWNTGGSSTITTILSPTITKQNYHHHQNYHQQDYPLSNHYRTENCWRLLTQVQLVAKKFNNYTFYCFDKKTFQICTLRKLCKVVLNVKEDILVTKVFQKFPIGDFYFDIAAVLQRSRKDHNSRFSTCNSTFLTERISHDFCLFLI